MRQAALILVASLAAAGTAHAQAWPNARPSPYGGPTAPPATTAAPTPMPPPANNGGELGTPPHALGAPSSNNAPAPPAQATTSAPSVADLDNPQGARATAALNVLEAQGYADFSEFRPEDGMYTAMVRDGGQRFRVVINPDTGQISRQ